MKRTILRAISVIATLLLSLSITVHGVVLNPIDVVDVDGTQLITISGQLGVGKNNRMLAITVSGPDEGGTSVPPIAHLGQVDVAFDGTYSYTFSLDGSTGNYNVAVSCGAENDSKSFPFVNPGLVNVILRSIDQAALGEIETAKTQIENILFTKKRDLLIEDLTLYWEFADKSIIMEKLIANKPYEGNYDKFISVIKETAILYYVNNATTGAEILSLAETYSDDIRLNLDNVTYKNTLTQTQRDSVLAQMVPTPGVGYTTLESINDTFEELCFQTAVLGTEFWQTIDGILKDNKDLIGIDFTDYNKLDDVSGVCTKFLHQTLTFDTAKTLFTTAVSEALEAEQNDPNDRPQSSPSTPSRPVVIGKVDLSDESETTQNHQSKFKDISQVSWAHEALYYLEDKGVIAGVEEDKFDPMASVTREQFIKMLLCAFNLNDSSAAVDFNDVDGNAWYYPYVASAVKAGIVTGRDDNSFGVGERITRQDMAVLVNRCIQKTGYRPAGSDLTFDDVNSIADYAKEAVGFMKYAKVINGMGDGNFAPAQTATRAQATVIIYNAMKITGYVEEA